MEYMNNCMGRIATLDDSRLLDGGGEHITIPEDYEGAEIDTTIPHNGQGDFVEFVDDCSEKDSEKLQLRRTNEFAVIAVRLASIATLHPLEYAKVLIQLGHEPMPAQLSKSFFGRPIKIWPNLFKYIGHIRNVDGFYGCYRGLAPRLLGYMVSLIGGKEVVDRLGFPPKRDDDVNKESYEQFVVTLKRDVALTATGLVLSHPFHVISLRMMAQFVGHETTYKSIFGSFLEIYRNDGLTGFFAGLIPKLVCDMSCVVLTSSVTYLINKYYVKDRLLREYNGGFVQYIFATMLYPLQVVATCMAVTSSGLKAAQTPRMLPYKNWIECWMDLEARGQHKRGAALFWRSTPIKMQLPRKTLAISTKDT